MIQDYNPQDLLAVLTGQNATSSAFPSFQQDLMDSGIKAGELPSQSASLAGILGAALQKQQQDNETKNEQRSDIEFYRQNGYKKGEFDSGMGLAPLNPSGKVEMLGSGALKGAPLTQKFGNRSGVEKYSGGVNLGADFGTKPNTKLPVPQGRWQVVQASPGFNSGSGNLVKVRNLDTGEILGFEHLGQINVKPGQQLQGGTVVGLSGGGQSGSGRGNSTGPHSSILYINPSGQYGDILKSPYARYYFGG